MGIPKFQILSVHKDRNGNVSIGRLTSVLGAIALTFGFYREALTNGLVWQDYIAYATAMTIMYAPAKAIELIHAIKGTNLPQELEEKKDGK